MNIRASLVAIAAGAVLASTALSAWADEPPAPPPPDAAPPPTPPPAPAERPIVVEQAQPVAPAPRWAPSDPCAQPCDPYPAACCQPRDECGWPVDACGTRYGRFEITLEGTFALLGDPEGDFGETAALFGGTGNQLTWDGIEYDGEIGGRGALAYHLTPLDRLELRGGWYGDFSASTSQSGEFGASPGISGVGDVSRPVLADFTEDATLWGVELNWWTELSCEGRYRFDVGVGGRYMRFDEEARVDLTTNGPGGFPVADGFVESEVENTFAGGQIAAMLHVDLSNSFELSASAKGMIGSLNRDVTVSDLNVFAGGNHTSTREDDEIVFGLEAEVGLRLRLTRCIAVTGGYNLLFLDGVQRAHDSMDFTHSNSGAVQAEMNPDQLIVHTFFLGLNFNF